MRTKTDSRLDEFRVYGKALLWARNGMQCKIYAGIQSDGDQAMKRIEVIADDEGEIVEVYYGISTSEVACSYYSRQSNE